MPSSPLRPSSLSSSSAAATNNRITINLTNHPPKTPLGIILAPCKLPSQPLLPITAASTSTSSEYHYHHHHHDSNPLNSTTVVLVNYSTTTDATTATTTTNKKNTKGPIQKSNLIRIGDVLIEINGVNIQHLSFYKVMSLLRCLLYGSSAGIGGGNEFCASGNGNGNNHGNNGLKSLTFENGRYYYMKYCSHFMLQQQQQQQQQLSQQPQYHLGNRNTSNNNNNNNNNVIPMEGIITTTTSKPKNASQWNIVANQSNTIYKFHSYIHCARIKYDGANTTITSNNNDDEQNRQSKSKSKSKNTQEKQSYIQYEIKCTLSLIYNNNQYYQTTWSIWKRYTDFLNLHEHFLKTFPTTIMEHLSSKFPMKHKLSNVFHYVNIFESDIDESFVKKRMNDLNEYWSTLYKIGDLGSGSSNSENGYLFQDDGGGNHSHNNGVGSCGLLFFDFGDPTSSYRYSYKMAEFLNVKREYFHIPSTTSTVASVAVGVTGGVNNDNNNNIATRQGAVGEGGNSVGSRPNEIHVDGVDESTSAVSILSNSINTCSGNGGEEVTSSSSSLMANNDVLKSSDLSVTSDGMLSGVGIGGAKKKKKRKKVAAKSAFERRLLDDL